MNATAPREGQTFSGTSRLARWASLVKLPHTLFALPFALVGVLLASYQAPVGPWSLAWVVVAFTSARFAAMAFNRIVDRDVDARNPRTAQREIPRGALPVRDAGIAVGVAGALFVLSAGMLNPLCLALSPLALAWVLWYSRTKRFTRWAHLVLGVGLSIAPAGGYLAITGAWSRPWWLLPVLSLGVAAWVAGFDILYALADAEFDRREGLHSIPAALGVPRAIVVARALHAASVVALGAATLGLPAEWRASAAGALWLAGVLVVAALLAWEHRLVHADDLSRLDAAFFTMNGVISITFFGFVLSGRLAGPARDWLGAP
ncbi:MAG: UbiA family prenyltransferase [Gemmatimonadetes bacterium]|nr:UbiA family prenyltransferase [Gemmatimonadota bacterium]